MPNWIVSYDFVEMIMNISFKKQKIMATDHSRDTISRRSRMSSLMKTECYIMAFHSFLLNVPLVLIKTNTNSI